MSAADKARYYLEQSIPELQEYEKKGVFSKPEISAIAKKRSDFEHRINASGCSPKDFTRYAEYEMNLESLYRMRVKRLGIRARLHYGTRRIFFILDRATRKFPADIPLWIQYIEFAKREKSSGVLARTFASVLKLHPTKPELWIYAARHSVEENADITEGRSHMQRGLRFCKKSKALWKEYAKLEMVFVTKVFMRRELLGIDAPKKEDRMDEDDDENTWKVPEITAEELNPELAKKDQSLDMMALENVDTNPALNGALAIAIFNQAMKEIPSDAAFALDFYYLFTQFAQLKCCTKILEHVLTYAKEIAPTNSEVLWCAAMLPLVGIDIHNPIFPTRLAAVLKNMGEAIQETDDKKDLYSRFTTHFKGLLEQDGDIDPAIHKILSGKVRKYSKLLL
ncbi:half-A-TPR repeat-containing protein [Geopyxis carbonaria]|nr:half-A-TPR repeat-containing protein [Geopyxis carbonaria]